MREEKAKEVDKRIPGILQTCESTAKRHNLPLAAFRHPYDNTVNIIIGAQTVQHFTVTLEGKHTGFVFSPYNNFSNAEGLFIPDDIHIHIDMATGNHQIKSKNSTGLEYIVTELKERINSEDHLNASFINADNQMVDENIFPSLPDYKAYVEQAIGKIKNSHFNKVVLARKKIITCQHAIDAMQVFVELVEHYPRAFVSYVQIPGYDTWIGSSPEILLKAQNGLLHTVALAGTKPFNPENNLPAWTSKEFDEQQYVTENIHECFQQSKITNYTTQGPDTVQAGSLMHLKTMFTAHLENAEFYKAAQLIELLHPTSAVCGTPKMQANSFIQTCEPFDRSFYAGYLGTIGPGHTLDLYVNIRSGFIQGKSLSLFAGSGITSASQPELENHEIQLKFLTLENALRGRFNLETTELEFPDKKNKE